MYRTGGDKVAEMGQQNAPERGGLGLGQQQRVDQLAIHHHRRPEMVIQQETGGGDGEPEQNHPLQE